MLEPYLQAVLAKGEDNPKWSRLRLSTKIDPGRVLELLEKHPLQNASADASIRNMVATELLGADPQEAEAVVSAIASPEAAALGLRVAERCLTGSGPRSECAGSWSSPQFKPAIRRLTGATDGNGSQFWDGSQEVG